MKTKKISILITGGAGYIGSVLANNLVSKNYQIFIIDNLDQGYKFLIPKKCKFYKGDFSDTKILKKIFKNKIDVIIHLAAYVDVKESTKKKLKYINNNYIKSKSFLNYCTKFCKNIIFSSTAAVYFSKSIKLNEKSIINPISPYAKSKYLVETYIKNFDSKKINYVILRFFNVVGAHRKLKAGLISEKPTHLIKKLCFFSQNKKKTFFIYGNKYKTKDGTAVRDYIHVSDLCEIIEKLSLKILKNKISRIFNCGYGKGFSVNEVIYEFNKISKFKLKNKYLNNRKGDIPSLIADSKKIKKYLKWRPKFNNLSLILKDSIKWEQHIHNNYKFK